MHLVYKTYQHNLKCPELQVVQYKDLLKSLLGDDINLNDFLDYFINLFCNLSNKPKQFFDELTLLDLFLLLLQLRIHTLGHTSHLILKPKEDQAKDINLHLNLQRIVDDLLNDVQPCYLKLNDIELIIWFPCLKFSADPNNIPCHIKACNINNQNILINNEEIALEIYKRLPAKLAIEVQNAIIKLYESLFSKNFLSYYEGCEDHSLSFDMQSQTLLWYCKLLFNEPLDVFLDNMFYLTYYGHFNTDYLEKSCAPGEYIYFTKKLQQELSSKAKDSSPQSSETGLNEFDM